LLAFAAGAGLTRAAQHVGACVEEWIEHLFALPAMTGWGHFQRVADNNLGLGWIYYALARVLRPTTAVVIGSYRGFVPLVLGKALQDNGSGELIFVDPSLVDDFWKDAAAVRSHFAGFGVNNIRHVLATTQQFVLSDDYARLRDLGLVFVDGYHSEEQARFDYEAFIDRLAPNGMVLLHDTARNSPSRLYGADRVYERRRKAVPHRPKAPP